MSKYKTTEFVLTMREVHEDGVGRSVNMEFQGDAITTSELLDEFLRFMKACGYCFNLNDQLQVVNEAHDIGYVPNPMGSVGGSMDGAFNGISGNDFWINTNTDVWSSTNASKNWD